MERRRSLSGPSSFRSERSAPRSTAMYRSGSVTSALTKTVCPDRRFSSPRKPEGPCLIELVPGGVDDRDLSFEDRDERVGPIADLVQQLTDGRRALLADLGESSELRRGEQWARGCRQVPSSVSGLRTEADESRRPGSLRRLDAPRLAPVEEELPLGEVPTTSIFANVSRQQSEGV